MEMEKEVTYPAGQLPDLPDLLSTIRQVEAADPPGIPLDPDTVRQWYTQVEAAAAALKKTAKKYKFSAVSRRGALSPLALHAELRGQGTDIYLLGSGIGHLCVRVVTQGSPRTQAPWVEVVDPLPKGSAEAVVAGLRAAGVEVRPWWEEQEAAQAKE